MATLLQHRHRRRRVPCQYAPGRSLNGRGSLSHRDRISGRRVTLSPGTPAVLHAPSPRAAFARRCRYTAVLAAIYIGPDTEDGFFSSLFFVTVFGKRNVS